MSEAHVSVAALKARLSEYLRRAKAGEAVIVTDRGKPVARLAPLEGELALEGRMDELAGAGLVRRALRPLVYPFPDRTRPKDPEGRSLQGILEERAEGW